MSSGRSKALIALLIIVSISLVLCLVPGLPLIPFVGIAVLALFVAIILSLTNRDIRPASSLSPPRRGISDKRCRYYVGIFIVIALALVIIPLPGFLLDILLTISILLVLSYFLASLFSLLTRNIRVAIWLSKRLWLILAVSAMLCIYATRLIIAKSAPGEVIRAFGSFLVGANYIIGWLVLSVDCVVVGVLVFISRYVSKKFSRDESYKTIHSMSRWLIAYYFVIIFFVLINMVLGFAVGLVSRSLSLSEAFALYSIQSIGLGFIFQKVAFWSALSAFCIMGTVPSLNRE